MAATSWLPAGPLAAAAARPPAATGHAFPHCRAVVGRLAPERRTDRSQTHRREEFFDLLAPVAQQQTDDAFQIRPPARREREIQCVNEKHRIDSPFFARQRIQHAAHLSIGAIRMLYGLERDAFCEPSFRDEAVKFPLREDLELCVNGHEEHAEGFRARQHQLQFAAFVRAYCWLWRRHDATNASPINRYLDLHGKTVRGKIYGCDPIDAPGQCSFSLNKLLGRVPRLFGWYEQGNGHPSLGRTKNPFPQSTQITRKTVDVVISTFPI